MHNQYHCIHQMSSRSKKTPTFCKNYASKILFKTKSKFLIVALTAVLPIVGWAQAVSNLSPVNRPEIKYKQRHSSLVGNDNLYADGIKIKRDLQILQEIQEERFFSMDDIPADELYGGLWDTRYAHVYKNVNYPDTFIVNLEHFTMPIKEGHVTSKYGIRRRRMHNGTDLKVQVGDTIYATFDGKVRVQRFEKKGYGNYLVLRHPNGLETIYGHLSKFLVDVDDTVKSGDPIALGGNTGRSTGSHLHLEFRFLGQAIDPAKIVDFDNYVCHTDEYVITKDSLKPAKAANQYTKGGVQYHRIAKGDTLYGIARKYGTTIAALRKKNNLGTQAVFRVGSSLRI